MENKIGLCIKLQKKLKENIKGNIFVGSQDNLITISINAGHGITYEHKIVDMSKTFEIDKVVNIVTYDYHRYIIDKFFVLGGEEYELV